MMRRRLPLWVWLCGLLVCALVISRSHFVADLSAFMPRMPNERQQLLVDQLRDGAIARIIMIGIEGGSAEERARLSRELVAELSKTGLFVGIENGDAAALERDQAYFFGNRYVLSPHVTPALFTADGLHDAIADSIEALSGNAGLMLKRLLPRDPTGETLRLLEEFSGNSQPKSVEGVWASRDGRRAVLLAYTRAPGTDTEAQSRAIGAVRQAFAALPGKSADSTIVMSGTSVFSVSSRNTIEGEVSRLAAASLALVVCLLLLVYRSLRLLALGLLPVVSGALAGITAVSLGFGQVHGLTLGFGTTLIGEAVDYSIYYFIQNDSNRDYFWRTVWLGVLTSIAGFAALLFSGFPGLAQLGLYSISGLTAAALVTRYVLPAMMPSQLNLRDLSRAGKLLDDILAQASRLRWVIAALALLAAAFLLFRSGPTWNRQLSSLSPISKAEQQLDQELRGDLGAPDLRYTAALTAPDEESALRQAERAGAAFQEMIQGELIGGYDSPATILPSAAAQRERTAAIPDAGEAARKLDAALEGLPIRRDRLAGFLTDLQAARDSKPLTRADLEGTSSALLFDSLLVKRASDYLVLMPLHPAASAKEIDLDKVGEALRARSLSNVVVIDMLEESTSLFDNYRHEALMLSGAGCLAILALLAAAMKSVVRALKIAVPLAGAVLCVAAAILFSGTQLTILHLIGLLLVVAIGSNYALFFESVSADTKERHQKQISLVVANLTAVGSFGLLGFSKIPILAAIGSTVGPGAFLCLVFSAILTRELPATDRALAGARAN